MGRALKEDPSLFPKMARVQARARSRRSRSPRAKRCRSSQRAVEEAEPQPGGGEGGATWRSRSCEDGLSDDAYWRQSTSKRIAVIFAGPGMNILVAILLVATAYMIGVPGDADRTVKNVEAEHAGRADRAPARRHDRRGERQADAELRRGLAIRSGRRRASPIELTVLRDGKPVTLGPVRTKKIGDRWALGFEPGWQEIQYGPIGRARATASSTTWSAAKATVTFLPAPGHGLRQEGGLEPGRHHRRLEPGSVALTFTLFLLILGLISLSLAILNLLPLLPLDGGHILFSIIEGLRGRAVGREVYERVSAIGIALFLVLMFIGLSNDINRLGGG